MTGWLLPAAVLAMVMLEASVGRAGTTGYIAVMGLLGVVLAFSALRLVTEVHRSRVAADLEGEEPVPVRRRSVSGLVVAAGGLVGSRLGEAVAAG